MLAGDDVGAIVVETGSTFSKFGYAGENTPKGVLHTAVAYGSVSSEMEVDSEKRKGFVGQQLFVRRDHTEVVHPVKNGVVEDFDAVELIWNHGIEYCLRDDAASRPLLLVESSYNTDVAREKLCQFAFEKMNTPALFIAKDGVLSALSHGKTSALVLDLGGGHSAAVPVYDGYVLGSSLLKTKVSGNVMDDAFGRIYGEGIGLASSQSASFKTTKISPRYVVKRKLLGESKRSYEILKFPETSASYYNFMKGEVLRDIKESVARVSDEVFDLEANASIPTLPYELPDGTILQVGTPRFSVPETLFVPSKALGLPPKDDFDGYDFKGIHHMINDAISKVDFDLRRELYQNITVTGGVSLIPGLTDRLAKELEALVHSSFKVRVVAAATPAERQFGSWIGGSILGSLGSFQQMWISKGEYEEHGAKIVQSRCT